MKYLRFRYIFILFLCGLIVLAGCQSEPGQSALATSATTITNTLQPTKTNVILETLTPTKTATYATGLSVNSSQKILLNVTTTYADIGICYPQGSTEVWQSSFPFTEKQVLLRSDPNTNYFAPTYSPDGQWIAYIESKPVIENLDLENPSTPNPIGNDSIWIMRQDGSEKQRISKYFDSFSVYDSQFCRPYSRIHPNLSWSPDGKYIYFIDFQVIFKNSSADYHILNVETKESFIFNTDPNFKLYGFSWLSESGKFLYSGDNQYWINQITSEGIDLSKAQLLPIDSSIQNSTIDYESALNEPIIISQNDSLTITALWQFDPTHNSWSKIIEYSGNNPRIGTSWGVYSGGDDDLYYIDLKSLRIIGPISYKNKIGGLVYQFPEVKNASGDVMVSILDSETNNIWGIDPNSSQEMFQLVNWDSLDPEEKYSIIDQYPSWSWSP
jgi:hypothetical protein